MVFVIKNDENRIDKIKTLELTLALAAVLISLGAFVVAIMALYKMEDLCDARYIESGKQIYSGCPEDKETCEKNDDNPQIRIDRIITDIFQSCEAQLSFVATGMQEGRIVKKAPPINFTYCATGSVDETGGDICPEEQKVTRPIPVNVSVSSCQGYQVYAVDIPFIDDVLRKLDWFELSFADEHVLWCDCENPYDCYWEPPLKKE